MATATQTCNDCEKRERADQETASSTDVRAPNNQLTAFSAFNTCQKRWIVFLTAFAGWFSTLSSSIFFPAITSLAGHIHTSIQNINLTVTSYLLFAAVAPAVVGTYADNAGRRPALLASLAIYVTANVGLALQTSFPALFVLRMVQSAGIAGTFSIGYGMVADIATPAERGSFAGVLAFGTNTAPSLGPVLGAALNATLGWRAIFWFLAACAGGCLIAIALSLPETSRLIVGNGSLRACGIHRVPLSLMRADEVHSVLDKQSRNQMTFKAAVLQYLNTLRQKDKLLVLSCQAILYMTYTCLLASLSTLFIDIYHFDELQAGLIYLPFGLGCTFMAYLAGKILDRDYRMTAQQNGLPVDKHRGDDLTNFPIEKARLKSIFVFLPIMCSAIVVYGWCLRYRVHFSVCLVMQLILGVCLQPCFSTINTLLVDLDPQNASTVQAMGNLMRCLLAAGALACLQPIITRIGEGVAFTLLAAIDSVSIILFLIERLHGAKWRRARSGPTLPAICP